MNKRGKGLLGWQYLKLLNEALNTSQVSRESPNTANISQQVDYNTRAWKSTAREPLGEKQNTTGGG